MTRPHAPLPRTRDALRRVVVENVRPAVDGGAHAVKRTVGEALDVEADVFADGHEEVAAFLEWRHGTDERWTRVPMAALGNDRFAASFTPDRLGSYWYRVVGILDRFATWASGVQKKHDAGRAVAADLEIGARLLDAAATKRQRAFLRDAADRLRAGDLAPLAERKVAEAARTNAPRRDITTTLQLRCDVDRARARFSTWYELFPRSASGDAERHGRFTDVERLLPYVAGMGFDVLYLPPIHPIGVTARKGANNALVATPDDVGSPWSIGGEEGGHTSIHPQLGTVDDFRSLREAAAAQGLELALDIAYQCSPDHPYVREHPEWFRIRPDGSIQHAENPPKLYEDIVPLDFECDEWQSLWTELRDVFEFWIAQGVRIFRVDNPHTKPFAFWEWVIEDLRARYPDVILLSEAFTRPRVMERLAKIGFNQSYTYFAWRNDAWELRQYFEELVDTELAEYLRPNVWPNTPDILTEYLQHGGRSAFTVRAVLAATLAASYGIYGPAFELTEHTPREPGSEEYLDSEKYQIRGWDLDRRDSLRPLLARLNAIRRAHCALQTNRGLRFHDTDNGQLLCYSKRDAATRDVVLVVVTLDPFHRQSGHVYLDLGQLGVDASSPFRVWDVLGGQSFEWHGHRNYVELHAATLPAHVFVLQPEHDERAETRAGGRR